ncbi:MAG: cobalt ECF transporter T component CbiQ [Chlorobium sp.]|nr:cobalt ECF transporter T component CbiQ [Chlorobium sp.]
MKNLDIQSRDNQTLPSFFSIGDRPALILSAIFVLFVLLVPKYNLPAMITYASFPVLLITAANIPVKPLLHRLALLSPFVLIMAAANPWLDRRPLFDLFGITISTGMISGMVIVFKTMVTMTALQLLIVIIPFYRLALALRGLGAPELFVTQLLLVYRYSFLLAEEAGSMKKARDIRSFKGKGKDLFTTAQLIGSLLIRTTSRAEKIFMAMTARGFQSGLAKKTETPPFSKVDIASLVFSFLSFLAVRIVFIQ